MNKLILFTIFMSLVVIKGFAYYAYHAEIDGIYYYFEKSERTAQVTYGGVAYYIGSYSGSVVIPETVVYNGITYTVTSIGPHAFYGCSELTSLTIPSSVTKIGYEALYCTSLKLVYCFANKVPSAADRSIYLSNSTLYVQKGLLSAYKTNSEWNHFGSIKEMGTLIDGIYYDLNDSSKLATVTSGRMRYSGSVIIPKAVVYNGDTYKVTTIEKGAFNDCSNLTSVAIPNSVTSIGDYAFFGCSNLSSITIPNSMKSIGDYSFYGTNLRTLIVGIGVLSIGNNAFSTPTKTIWLTNTPPQGYTNAQGTVNYVANSQYSGLNDMKEYTFLSSMFEVDGIRYVPVSPSERTCDAIDCVYDESAENITIKESVTNKGFSLKIQNIQPYLCYSNTYIKNVNIESGYKGDVPSYSFYGCTGIISAKFNNQGDIAKNAFYGCTGITSATINNQGNIGSNAFYNCATSDSATFSITNNGDIGTGAFKGCTKITQLIIDNKGNIGGSCFSGCIGITSATINNQGNIGQYAFYGSATSNPAMFTITNSGDIGTSAFSGCTKITQLTIDNKGSIGENCFYGCTSLQTTTLGNNIPDIGASAFKNCSNLGSIVIPDVIQTIGKNTFKGCSSMTSVKIGNGIKLINDSTFSDCSSLKDVKIGNSVTSIATSAFSGCKILPKIQIPQNVTVIGNNVFSGCTGLKTVIMADRETEGDLKLGNNGSNPIFADCPLDSVYIGRNISYSTSSSYGYSPFYRNTSLRSVTITDKETEISENEFYGCTNLQNVKIGDGVTSIGNWAFSGCSSLKNFSFGTQVKTIGKEAFSDCTAVTAISSKAQTPPTCGSQALDDINKWECTLYVPEGHVADYQSTDQWKEFFFIEEGDIPVYIRGDVNGDGVVNGTDIQAIINLIVESLYDEKCDVNEDGRVNGTDIQEVINIIVNAE